MKNSKKNTAFFAFFNNRYFFQMGRNNDPIFDTIFSKNILGLTLTCPNGNNIKKYIDICLV